MTAEERSETPHSQNDNEVVGTVVFYSDDYRFFIEGLKALRKDLAQFEGIKNDFEIDESPYDYLIERIDHMVARIEPRLKDISKGHQSPIFEDGVKIGSVRLLKAGGLYAVAQAMAKRKHLLKTHKHVPKSILGSVDQKISQMKEVLETGVMNGLPPADIFFELAEEPEDVNPQMTAISSPKGLQNTTFTAPRVPPYLDQIPIVDQELRNRCLHLLTSLQAADIPESEIPERLDTAVREMSVILEDRVRKVAGLETSNLEGVRLMAEAFTGASPPLRFSVDKSIQDSAHHLYRGYSGFVRNEVMHRLVKTYTVERVLQLLGLVDYLLSLLSQANRKEGRM